MLSRAALPPTVVATPTAVSVALAATIVDTVSYTGLQRKKGFVQWSADTTPQAPVEKTGGRNSCTN